jgi:hypothetical protein
VREGGVARGGLGDAEIVHGHKHGTTQKAKAFCVRSTRSSALWVVGVPAPVHDLSDS